MTTVFTQRTAQAAARSTVANDGVTISAVTGASPTWGYAVALPGHEETYVLAEDPAQSTLELESIIAIYIHQHRAILAWPNRFVGTWLHQGRIFLDISEVIRDRDDALKAGKDRDQLAIFDLLRGEEISLA